MGYEADINCMIIDNNDLEKVSKVLEKYDNKILWSDFSANAYIGNEVVNLCIVITDAETFDKIVLETNGFKYFNKH